MSEQLSKPEQKTFNIDKDNLASFMKAVIFGSVVILVVVLAVYFTNFHNGISDKQEVWGAFGDFVGGILNPIFGLFGLIALLITITLQTKELEATHIELRRSAHAQELMEKTAKEQAKTMERQRFESTFFSLLDQHNNAYREITKAHSPTNNNTNLDILENNTFRHSTLEDSRRQFHRLFEKCGQYYRSLYQLLKFIAVNAPDNQTGTSFDIVNIQTIPLSRTETLYSDIVKSFISNQTGLLLAIHCSTNDEADQAWRYKLLVERYGVLDNINLAEGESREPTMREAAGFYINGFPNMRFGAEE